MTLLTEEGKCLRSASLENARLREEVGMLRERCEAYKGQVWAGSQEIERLREALKPLAGIDLWRDTYPDAKFNSMPSHMDGYLTVDDVLKARAALGNEQDAPAKDRG